MKKLTLLTLSSAVLLLTACAAQPAQTTTSIQVTSESKTETTQANTAETTQATTVAQMRVDVEEVQETVGLYLSSLMGMQKPEDVSVAGLMYLTKPDETNLINSDGVSVYEVDLADVVDVYNEVFPGVYNEADVLNYLKNNPNGFKEDASAFDDDRPLNSDIRIGGLVYYAGNKKLAMAIGGIGGVGGLSISQPDQWVQQNGQLTVPVIASIPGQKNSQVVLELNQKVYTGGKERSLYTVVR